MEYFAGGLTVCARVFSALSRHLESGVDPGNEVALADSRPRPRRPRRPLKLAEPRHEEIERVGEERTDSGFLSKIFMKKISSQKIISGQEGTAINCEGRLVYFSGQISPTGREKGANRQYRPY